MLRPCAAAGNARSLGRGTSARCAAGRAALVATLCARAAMAGEDDVERVRVNGVPLAIVERNVRGLPSQVARELLRRWNATPDVEWVWRGVVGEQLLLARQRGSLHESWLVSRHGRGAASRIVVSVRDLARAVQPVERPPLALPRGARLLSVVESDGDRARRGVEFLLWSPDRPETARVRWDAALRSAGWEAHAASPPACRERRRAQERLVVCLAPSGPGTTAVLQWRRP